MTGEMYEREALTDNPKFLPPKSIGSPPLDPFAGSQMDISGPGPIGQLGSHLIFQQKPIPCTISHFRP